MKGLKLEKNDVGCCRKNNYYGMQGRSLKSEESDGENKKWFFIFDCTAYTYVRRCVVEFNLKSVLM
jgi:hypothetical protein